jgi:tetratricopeptide (TPR) repeat protein
LGKSRLIAEWKAAASRAGHTGRWFEGQCLSYGQNIAYHLLISLLRSMIGVPTVSAETETRMALRMFLDDTLGVESADAEHYLAHLLALHLTDEERQRIAQLDPQSLQAQYVDAFRRAIRALAQQSPLVFVLEDVHWADPSSVDVLEKLLPLVFQARILFCFVSRDERNSHGWKLIVSSRALMGETALDIRLQPLSEGASHQLVSNLLEIEALPERVRSLIHRKAEGNPFFIEEVIRMLIDEGMIERQGTRWVAMRQLDTVEIPDNLLGVLLARIDRQPDDVKRTMRIASVIGRQFPVKVLEQVLEQEETQLLSERLGALETASLIRLAQIEPEIEYLFRHALIQDAAYESLLRKDRQRLHLAVGMILEQIYPERIDELAPMLARHFYEGSDLPRACHYFRLAGDNAARQYANMEAVDHYSRAIELTDEQDYALPGLYRARGVIQETLGNFDAAREDHEAALDLGRRSDNRRAEWRAALDLGMLWAGRDYAHSQTYFEQALALAETLNDPAALAQSLNRIGNWLVNQEAPADGIGYHRRALGIFEELGDKAGTADTLDLLAMASWLAGTPNLGADYYRRTVDLLREVGNPYGLSSTLVGMGLAGGPMFYGAIVPDFAQDGEDIFAYEDEAVAIARSIGWRAGEAYALSMSGVILATTGEIARGLSAVEAAAAIAAEIGHRQWDVLTRYAQAFVYRDLWAFEEAQRLLEPALVLAQELNSTYWIRAISCELAAAFGAQGRLDEADALLDTVVARTVAPQTLSQRMAWHERVEVALARHDARLALECLDFLMRNTEIGDARNELNYPGMALLRGIALYQLIRSGEDTSPDTATRAEASLQAVYDSASRWPHSPLFWKVAVQFAALREALGQPDEARDLRARAQTAYDALCQTIPPHLLDTFRRGAEAFLND